MRHLKNLIPGAALCRAIIPSLLLSLFLPGVIFSATPLDISENPRVNVIPHVDYMMDHAKEFTIDDIASGKYDAEWKKSDQEYLNFGVNPSAVWLRVQLKLGGAKDRYFAVEYSGHDRIDLYSPDGRGGFLHSFAGDTLPFAQREISYRNPVFKVESAGGDVVTYYFRFFSSGSFVLPMFVITEALLKGSIDKQNFFLGLYYGIMLVILAFSFFIWYAFRNDSYLYFVFYLSMLTLAQFSLDGYSHQHLWPTALFWSNIAGVVFIFMLGAGLAQFTRSFLNFQTTSPIFDRLFKLLVAVNIALIPVVFFAYSKTVMVAILINMVMPLMIVIASVILVFKKNHLARYFIIGFGIYLGGVIFRAFLYAGIIPSSVVGFYSLHIGSIAEIIFLSIALIERITAIRKENENNQKLIIQHQKQALAAQAKLNEAYARFVPQQFLQFLEKKSIEDVKLGDAVQRDMTVMFLDIRSFTAISEQMSPEENFRFLNAIFKRVGPIVRNHGGFIDKYIGDAIMALFPSSPEEAVKAAVSMQKMILRLNRIRERMSRNPIEVGIGIHTGNLMLGTIGESQRMEGTVIADAVNLASRIEGLTKRYHARILISQEVADQITNPESYGLRRLDKIKVKGKENLVTILEVFDGDPETVAEKKRSSLKEFLKGVEQILEGNKKEGLSILKNISMSFPEDKTVHALAALTVEKGV